MAAVKRSDIPVAVLLRAVQQMNDESRASIAAAGGITAVLRDIRSMTRTPDLPERLPQYPYKVVLARIEQLAGNRHGALLDWGVVINRPWLTDAGKAKLAELESL